MSDHRALLIMMQDDDREYSLDELATATNMPPRTVRYYISEGLLPPPLTTGRNARYGQAHLYRLLVISDLKDRYLSLKEIRSTLEHLSDDDIRLRAFSLVQSAGPSNARPASPAPARTASAQAYLRRALQESGVDAAPQAARLSAPLSAPGPRTQSEPMPDLARSPFAEPETPSWKRLPISDDAELLLEEQTYLRMTPHLPTLLTLIRRMLDES